jgi:hypothetical protein
MKEENKIVYKEEFIKKMIEAICDKGGQNAEMIAEYYEEENEKNKYSETEANELLEKMEIILINNINKLNNK